MNRTYTYFVKIIYKKLNMNTRSMPFTKRQILYCLRNHRNLNFDSKILETFYSTIVQSVVTYDIANWYGNCGIQAKASLTKKMNICSNKYTEY